MLKLSSKMMNYLDRGLKIDKPRPRSRSDDSYINSDSFPSYTNAKLAQSSTTTPAYLVMPYYMYRSLSQENLPVYYGQHAGTWPQPWYKYQK